MPLVYMNSWASLALRALALVAFAAVAALAAPPQVALAATALLLAASAAHPLSVSLRLAGGAPLGLLAVAEAVVALALAAMLAIGAVRTGEAGAHAAALVAPLAVGLAVLALVGGLVQHDRLRRDPGRRWAAMPLAVAAGAAGTALLAALQAEAAAAAHALPAGPAVLAALALAAWITHSALRLRRARRSAARARLRDWTLTSPHRPPAEPQPARRLHPAELWS
jgi:hypothetical protein